MKPHPEAPVITCMQCGRNGLRMYMAQRKRPKDLHGTYKCTRCGWILWIRSGLPYWKKKPSDNLEIEARVRIMKPFVQWGARRKHDHDVMLRLAQQRRKRKAG